jgi:hypothetical protein
MSQFDGLADRTRVFPKDAARQQFGSIEVDSIKCGAIEITAIGGTRYANGRLLIAGLKDNSTELELHPGPECSGRGVMTQILMFTRRTVGWMRHCFSWNFDGEGDLFVEDQGVSGDRLQAPWYRITGQKTYEVPGDDPRTGKHYEYGEDNGGRYIDAYFANGSDEYYLADGRRVGLQSLIGAMVKIAEKNGIPFDVR